MRSWVSLFRQEATKCRHMLLPIIIKEIQIGPFTESTDQVAYGSKEYKQNMHVTPKRDMHVPIIDHWLVTDRPGATPSMNV